MPLSQNIHTYEDCRAIFDRALLSENGVMVTRPTPGSAINLRQRCYKFRALDRLESQKLFPESDPRYGTSAYDLLSVETVENIVYIRKFSADQFKIEDIPSQEEVQG